MQPIFTRYLYEKRETMHALLVALIKRQVDESLFWTYELYFSGFELELWDWVACIYEEFYERRNPRYKHHLFAKYDEWSDTQDPLLIGSVILTLAHRLSDTHLYLERMGVDACAEIRPLPPSKEKYVFQFNTLANYTTVSPAKLTDVSLYSIPKTLTRFFMDRTNLRELTDDAIRDAYLSADWLYYCRETPLWLTRIREHDGTIDHTKKRVVFPNDDLHESFYEKYGLEPDEQSREIHEIHGIRGIYKLYSIDEFRLVFS